MAKAKKTDALARFSPATAEWFRNSFNVPTPAQEGAWNAISSGHHCVVVAPTGSGKTLSAFLWAIDRMTTEPAPEEKLARCRVLYISPMKALAVDVERNLRAPLVGIGHAAARLGVAPPDISVSVRSGDTPAIERRQFARTPSDILITTPESLFLMLTSAVREALKGVQTVIVDEVHAVAGTKRGAHLALSLDRLDALLDQPAQRVGLSATVRPVEEVARFLAGGRPVEIVQPVSTKQWDLEVVVPVPDLGELAGAAAEISPGVPDLSGPAAGQAPQASIWPHVEERIVDLIASHRSTIVFANSRRLAERLTSRLNEIWEDRLATAQLEAAALDGSPIELADAAELAARAERHPTGSARTPAVVMAQAGSSRGAMTQVAVLARAHHGSVSKDHRAAIEDDLKAGRLPAVVATSSLELGIDMGAVDLVIQVESPPSVASGLQRVGRAGHQVGAVSQGVMFPKFRGDLVQTAVVVERMRAGAIESLRIPANPVDVLAQHIVAMCAMDEWSVADLEALVRRSASFAGLPHSVLEATLDMLAGRYPSDEFAELRPRIVWDRVTDTLTGRRGAQRLAVTSGGTIPDRGLYAVFLASGEGPGRRVGELDEEMVYESRVGDVFTLGTSTWRIEDITHDRVLVTPAPGQAGKLPFWKGDQQGRPAELGRALGAFVREIVGLTPERARERVTAAGLDEWAADNLLGYLHEQREATRHVPDDRTIVVERFRDEIGDWRVAVLSPFGGQVHAPWALCVAARMRERFGVDVQAMHGDDGIVFRLPDLEFDEASGDGGAIGQQLIELISMEPDEVSELVTTEIGGSALFAARFRECAARALLLPRRRPDRRQPLWQQRQRSAALLAVASQYPTFPIVLEAVRECVQDVFDVPGLVELMTQVRSRAVTLVDVESRQPSPFAKSLVFGYVAQYLYEGDSPLAERRAAALALDPSLLAELLGQGEVLALRDLLDPEAVARTEAELQRLTPERGARDGDDLSDLVRVLGPLSMADIVARAAEGFAPAAVEAALAELESARRIIAVRVGGDQRWAAIEDAARLRDALGTALPVGVPMAFLESVPDPLGDLVARFARTHGPFAVGTVASWWGLGPAVVHDALRRLVSAGRVVEGELLPTENGGGHGPEFCDAEVLRLLRRRSLAALRHEVEPVDQADLARFLPQWQGVGGGQRGREGLLRAVEQLTGAVVPASALETLVLPARVAGYRPSLLDEVMSAGEVVWRGHGSLPGDDGWVSLHLADAAHLTLTPPEPLDLTDAEDAVLDALAGGGAWFFRDLARRVDLGDVEVLEALWSLVWSGRVTNDTAAPLRALLSSGRTAHKRTVTAPRSTRYSGRRGSLGRFGSLRGALAGTTPEQVGEAESRAEAASLRAGRAAGSGPPSGVGRWALLPVAENDPTVRAVTTAELLLDRYGVLTRGSVMSEDVPGGFAAVYRVLAAAEEAGKVRRGYFVEGLGASQFAPTGAVDRLRSLTRLPGATSGSGSGSGSGAGSTGGRDRVSRDSGPDDQWLAPVPRSDRGGDSRGESSRLPALVLAASDPANPYGAALGWPERPVTDPTDPDASADVGAVTRASTVGGTARSSGSPSDDSGRTASADPPAARPSRRKGHQPGRKAGALVVLVDGELVLYVERGGKTMLCWSDDDEQLQAAADALALSVREGALGRLTVEKADGASLLGSGHPLVQALSQAGFHMTPRGLRLRR